MSVYQSISPVSSMILLLIIQKKILSHLPHTYTGISTMLLISTIKRKKDKKKIILVQNRFRFSFINPCCFSSQSNRIFTDIDIDTFYPHCAVTTAGCVQPAKQIYSPSIGMLPKKSILVHFIRIVPKEMQLLSSHSFSTQPRLQDSITKTH